MSRARANAALYRAIGESIRSLRETRGISAKGLAMLAGATEGSAAVTGCRVERGQARMTVDALYRYARALGVDPRRLLPANEEES